MMISAQLERLQKDSAALGDFISQLETSGNKSKIDCFMEKKNYLDTRIAEITGT